MKNKVLFSASLFHALNDAATVTIPMIFPLLYTQQFIIKKYFHIGILSNLGLLVTLLFQIIIANISGKVEHKFMLLVSYIGICLTLSLITLSSTFATLLFIYLTMRVFTSFYHSVGLAWVSKSHPSQGIDFAMGIQGGSGNLGVFLAFVSSGYLAQNFNWKVPLLVWAGMAFFLGSISFLAVRKTSTLGEEVSNPDFSSWMKTLKNIKIYIPGFVFGGACWGTTVFYAPSLLNHRFQIPLGQTGLYLALWIGVGTVMTYLFGLLSRHLGRLKISVSAFIGATLFLFVLGIAPSKELALVSLFFFGAFLFLVYPSFQSFVGADVSPENQAQAFSLAANVQMVTGAIVVLAAGYLSDRFGINSPFILIGILGGVISVFYLLKRSVLAKKLFVIR
ncbi:MAG: MFS transporter [Candidatus Aminicenantes bacterium]|nr:MFS transporter [Candidatus Aminicenantes bacterium]